MPHVPNTDSPSSLSPGKRCEEPLTAEELRRMYEAPSRPSRIDREAGIQFPHPIERALRVAKGCTPQAFILVYDEKHSVAYALPEDLKRLPSSWRFIHESRVFSFRQGQVVRNRLKVRIGRLGWTPGERDTEQWDTRCDGDDLHPVVRSLRRSLAVRVVRVNCGQGPFDMHEASEPTCPELRELSASIGELRSELLATQRILGHRKRPVVRKPKRQVRKTERSVWNEPPSSDTDYTPNPPLGLENVRRMLQHLEGSDPEIVIYFRLLEKAYVRWVAEGNIVTSAEQYRTIRNMKARASRLHQRWPNLR